MAAREFCSAQGSATVAMVKSVGMQALLEDMTRNTHGSRWLGAKYDNTSNEFKWVDGEPLNSTYTNWQEGYPTNQSNIDTCIEMMPENANISTTVSGKWVNVPCRKRNLVICQKAPTWSLEDAVQEIKINRMNIVQRAHGMNEYTDSVSEYMFAIREELVIAAEERNALREQIAALNSIYTESDTNSTVMPDH